MNKSQKIHLKRLKRKRKVDSHRKSLNHKRLSVLRQIRLIETRQAHYEEEAKNQGGKEGQNAKGTSRIQNWLSAFRIKSRAEGNEPGTGIGDSAVAVRSIEEEAKIAYEQQNKKNDIGLQVASGEEAKNPEDGQETEVAGEEKNAESRPL